MTTNLHDKMLAAIDALFSASDAVEEEAAENLLLDVRDVINKHKLAADSITEGLRLDDWDKIGCVNHDCDKCKAQQEPDRVKFERHWRKTRGDKKANRELPRHPLQPQTYIQDSANRHWVTWQAAVRSVAPQAQQEIDWKDQYEKQKRRADMWVAKYEADIGPLEKAGPVAARHGQLSNAEISAWAERHDVKGTPTDLRCMVDDAASLHLTLSTQAQPAQDQGQSCHCSNCEALSKELSAREPLTDEQFLELLLRTGSTELVSWATFVGESSKIGLLRGAKILKAFLEAAHGITKGNT